jgi:hypothetical protein
MQRRRRAHRHFGARRDARQRATAKDVGEPSPLLRAAAYRAEGVRAELLLAMEISIQTSGSSQGLQWFWWPSDGVWRNSL